MSWKPEVQTVNDSKWTGNALRFATKEEAEGYVFNLSMRWLLVTETRAIEVDEPVTHTWKEGVLTNVESSHSHVPADRVSLS